jgi:uncharacterized ferritin-like protein (DUF455 family)
MNFYTLLEQAIRSDDIAIKTEITEQCLLYYSQNEISPQADFLAKSFESASYSHRCKIVSPKALSHRKDFASREGLAVLVHAIAHIEYSAIDLALDAVYRYPDMPRAYAIDWLEVASDELRHFKMLEELLIELGFNYGDFSVHSGLFDAGRNTEGNILDRMAVIPRYFEASGLDVSPQIIKKLQNKHKLPHVAKLIEILSIIYREEIDHVLKGDKWFKYLCQRENKSPELYFEILERYDLLSNHRPHLNAKGRKEAGFTEEEIARLRQ